MTAGELDQRITLTRNTRADDEAGGVVETPVVYATVWANVRPMSGAEREQAQRVEAQVDYVVTIRNSGSKVVREGDIIGWRGLSMNIRFISYQPRVPWVVIEAQSGVAY